MDICVFKKFYILKMQLSTCIFLYLVTAVFFFLPIAYTFNNSRGAGSSQAVVLRWGKWEVDIREDLVLRI